MLDSMLQILTRYPTLSEQQYFEVEKRLAQSQDQFVLQTQDHHKLKEEFTKLSKLTDNHITIVCSDQ